MLTVKYESPAFSVEDAARFAREHYGMHVSARPLPGERDQNFYLQAEDGREFVLKIAHAAEERQVLDFQNRAMRHLAGRAPALALPRICATLDGEAITTVHAAGGAPHFLRLLTYVPGRLWAHTNPHTPGLLHSLGGVLGTLDAALQDFDHPAAHRTLKWDLVRAAWVRDYVPYVDAPARRAIVERFLRRFEDEVVPALPALRRSVIYNDGNDYNVLVGLIGEGNPHDRHVIGVIDLGDMVFTQTVCELAVATAYAIMDKVDPLAAAAHIVAGYHAAFPLTEVELRLLFPLIAARLCVTVTNAAYQRRVEPDNAYLLISERPAWDLLEKLDRVPPQLAHYTFRQACGLPACPSSPAVVAWLKDNADQIGPLLDPDPRTCKTLTFDLSVGSTELGNPADFGDVERLTRDLFGRMRDAAARVGIGRYDEARAIYTGDTFRVEGDSGPAWRTLHLGLDLFTPPGTPVLAPLDGIVHSFRDNTAPQDYGPTIILEHAITDGPVFYTLYGHLDRTALDGLCTGAAVHHGDLLGRVGDSAVNGGRAPHLHFQIVTDLLGHSGEFPSVALPSQRDLWLSLSPDPGLVAGIVAGVDIHPPAAEPDAGQILALRRQYVGRNLSISYARPLHIVRGFMQHLYDADGRAYLDTVNNVAHVGHCHPRVVRAGQAQMALLNTNSRYLHAHLARYAERLCATLPEPLRVCFFVCSGSEANELALRLARTHTGQRDIVVIDTAYHGNTGGLIEISPYKHAGPGGTGAPPHVHTVPMPDVYRGPYREDDPQAGQKYAGHVETAVEQIRRDGRGVGAFIAESILSCGGQIVLPTGYLQQAYRAVRAAGGVCIADEVQVGFGRAGTHFWAFETQGVVPDIVTMGKPIGNGHPLAAVVTTPEIAASFDNGMEYFNTFGGNPVSCAIGLAVLDVIADEGLQAHALQVGASLSADLRQLVDRHPLIGDVRGPGLFVGIELVRDRATREPAGQQATYLANRMREHGILMSTDGPFHNVLKIKPPLVFTQGDAEFLVATLDKVLKEDFLQA